MQSGGYLVRSGARRDQRRSRNIRIREPAGREVQALHVRPRGEAGGGIPRAAPRATTVHRGRGAGGDSAAGGAGSAGGRAASHSTRFTCRSGASCVTRKDTQIGLWGFSRHPKEKWQKRMEDRVCCANGNIAKHVYIFSTQYGREEHKRRAQALINYHV
ncbi:unnamed protein product, partial [Phaeothamnion confervicola]